MEAAGVPAGERGPPIHRLLWSLGIALPPPVLAGFWHNFVLMGSWFGALWGAMMWLLA